MILGVGESITQCGRQILRDEVGAGMLGGAPVQPGAGAAASHAGMPWASSPAITPASTSPAPAVASQGGALALIATRPSGRGDDRVGPLQQHHRAGARRRRPHRREPVVAGLAEHAGELAGVRGQHRRAAQPLAAAASQRVGIGDDQPPAMPAGAGSAACGRVTAEAGAADPDRAARVLQQFAASGRVSTIVPGSPLR